MHAPAIRRFIATLLVGLLAVWAPLAQAQDPAPAKELTAEQQAYRIKMLESLLDRAAPESKTMAAAGECNSASSPCCCRVGGYGQCTTAKACDEELAGHCVDRAQGCY